MELITLKKESKNDFCNTDFVHHVGEVPDTIKGKVRKKCGEVFIDEENLFNFLCTLCEASFDETKQFFSHVEGVHNNETIIQADPLGPDNNESRALRHEPNVQITTIDNAEIILPEYGEESIDSLNSNSNAELRDNEISESEDDNEGRIRYSTRKRTLRNKSDDEDESDCASDSSKKDPTFKVDIKVETAETEKIVQYCGTKPICDKCGKSFTSLRNLKKHKYKVNCGLAKEAKPIPFCKYCSKNFSSKRSLQRHQNTRKCRRKRNIDTVDKTDDIESHKYDGYKKCRYCDRYLPDSTKRVDHERIHTGEKPFQCQVCGKCFRTLALCKIHEQIHSADRLFKCEICDAAFKSRAILYAHTQRHGEKKFQCSYCEKSFFQKSEKGEHERFHTGEKPYKCEICDRYFSTSGSLQVHKRKHLNIRPHKCEYCGSCFFTKPNLRNHIVIHTGERPFVCTICNATFPRRKGLTSHEKIHSDICTYVCEICGQKFKQHSGLYYHMRSSHGVTLASKTNSTRSSSNQTVQPA